MNAPHRPGTGTDAGRHQAWLEGYEAGRRIGWLDALDFAFARGEASMDAALLDELLEMLRGDVK